MKIHQLEQFEAIASSRTMREAADKLYLSQPALSQNLKKLENELGCMLFDRSHNQLKLTAYDEILLTHVHRILFDLREVQAEIDAQKALDAQKIRIGSFYAPLDVFVMPQIEQAFPDLDFLFSRGTEHTLPQLLERGAIDIAIVPQQFALAHKESTVILEETLYVSLPAHTPLAGSKELAADAMRQLKFLVPSDLPGLSPWYAQTLDRLGVPSSSITMLPSREYLEEMDLTHKAHLTTSLMSLFTGSKSTRPCLGIEGPESTRTVVVCYDTANEKAAIIASFIENNREQLLSSHAFLPFLLYHDNSFTI